MLKTVKLLLSEQCNFGCKYCYEASTKIRKRIVEPIDLKTVKSVLRKFNNGIEIQLFGGEPMLHIPLMMEIIEWGAEYKNFNFRISTNGSIIDRNFLKFCSNANVRMHVTIDGIKSAHDLNRGDGSWDKAMAFYRICEEETKISPVIAWTIYKNTLPYLFESTKFLFDLQKNLKRSIFMNYVNLYEYKEEHLFELKKQMDLIKNWYLTEKIYKTNWRLQFFEEAEEEVFYGRHKFLSNNSCSLSWKGHGMGTHTINTDGDLLPCYKQTWEFKEKNQVYRIREDYDGFGYLSFNVKDISPCNTCNGWGCWICPTEWRITQNDLSNLYKPPEYWCKIFKIIVNCATEYIEERKKSL